MYQSHIKIYCCSKSRHAEMFRKIREEYPDLYFTARWPVTTSLASEAERPVYQWMGDNKSDILNSHAVVVYAEKGEHLRGAIFEAGFAHAAGIPIYVIGEHESYGQWQYYAGAVVRSPTLKHAMSSIRIRFRGASPIIGRGQPNPARANENE